MLHYIAITSIAVSCLLLGFIIHEIKQTIKNKPLRRWMRCGVCGSYQNTSYIYCLNHKRPAFLLAISARQQRRINHHLNNIWTHSNLKKRQEAFIAFTMRLEDTTDDEWSTGAAISVFERVGPGYLNKFADFLQELEEARGKRLDIDDVIEQFLKREAMEDDKEKIAQN